MTRETHRLESVTVMWQPSYDSSEKSTTGEQVITLTCQCGAITEYTWRLGATSSDAVETLALGLIAEAYQAVGPAVIRLRSLVSSSDLPTS